MNNGVNNGESSLVQLYMELTGASEARARSVFIYVCGSNGESSTNGARWNVGLLAERALAGGYASTIYLDETQGAYSPFAAAMPAATGV